jgi:phosphoribosylformylglycinamidine cyclo-ligase
MCVDDLVCCGARPLFFLDYQLLGRVDPSAVRQVMTGMAEGCRRAGCAIVGGELAEHPGLLEPGELDVAGFAVGIVEKASIIDGPARTRPGDVLIGLPSPGLRSNGYSLARHVLLERAGLRLDGPAWEGSEDWTLADELLRPSVIYTPAVLAVLDAGVEVHAVAHITGGGLPGNLPRVLASGVDAVLDASAWRQPRIFEEIRRLGGIEEDEMTRVFNLGLGMVLAVPPGSESSCRAALAGAGQDSAVVGELTPGARQVRIVAEAKSG